MDRVPSFVLMDVRRSLARSAGLLERLRATGDLVIGSTDAEQFARWETEERARDESYGIFCRRLLQDLKILRERRGYA